MKQQMRNRNKQTLRRLDVGFASSCHCAEAWSAEAGQACKFKFTMFTKRNRVKYFDHERRHLSGMPFVRSCVSCCESQAAHGQPRPRQAGFSCPVAASETRAQTGLFQCDKRVMHVDAVREDREGEVNLRRVISC